MFPRKSGDGGRTYDAAQLATLLPQSFSIVVPSAAGILRPCRHTHLEDITKCDRLQGDVEVPWFLEASEEVKGWWMCMHISKPWKSQRMAGGGGEGEGAQRGEEKVERMHVIE